MKPSVDLHRIGVSAWRYCVGTGTAPVRVPESAFGELEFDSLENCLRDAGQLLGAYFSRIDLRLGGRWLGSCATELLCQAPEQLAARIRLLGGVA